MPSRDDGIGPIALFCTGRRLLETTVGYSFELGRNTMKEMDDFNLGVDSAIALGEFPTGDISKPGREAIDGCDIFHSGIT
jgi:hypothetical protein